MLGNGQDGKNDAGQFAIIDKIPAGKSDVEFLFVAQQNDDCVSSRKQKCPVRRAAKCRWDGVSLWCVSALALLHPWTVDVIG